jgi:6-phosphofructo-2-kinase/fructose-2,6-biphosphatase
VSQVDGYLPGRLVFFLMNLHLVDRPILLTRHGESMYNVVDRIGGDSQLSPDGQRYARALARFVDERFPDPAGISIWTSSLRRAVQTAGILGRRSMPWRALDEINAGICDGMTYEQIRQEMPNEFTARSRDKFRYRYPRGESYEDVIARLDTVIIELERTRVPVLVIAHQAVLRAIYAYFHNIPPEQCTRLQIPLHTVIHLQPHAYGCQEERIPLAF